jgi:cobalt-precorrin-7 (C5)-methyltransferase
VICAYGDPNVSDKQLIERLDSREVEIEIIPGISSIQSACAKLKLPVEQTVLVTFHKGGSIEDEKQQLREQAKMGKRHMIVLPRPWDFMPADIARFLLSENLAPDREVTILQRVTLENESVLHCNLGELAEEKKTFSDLTILIIKPSSTDKRDGPRKEI